MAQINLDDVIVYVGLASIVVGLLLMGIGLVILFRIRKSSTSNPLRDLPRGERRRLQRLAVSGRKVPDQSDAVAARELVTLDGRAASGARLLWLGWMLILGSQLLHVIATEELLSQGVVAGVILPVVLTVSALVYLRWRSMRFMRTAQANGWETQWARHREGVAR